MDIYNAILRHKEALQEEEAWELSVRQAQENYRIMQNRYMNQLAILTTCWMPIPYCSMLSYN